MMRAESVRYLEQAGFHYKPAESPDLWTHLESRFAGHRPIGPKFIPMPESFIADLIARGEEVLLEALVEIHRRTGSLGRVASVIDLPYAVGTEASIPLEKADEKRVLRLIKNAGMPCEQIIHVMLAQADEIPCTFRMTATGGLYADGHTAGYYDLTPGERMSGNQPEADGADENCAWLATEDEIANLASEMEAKIEDITIITRWECEEMIGRVRKSLGGN